MQIGTYQFQENEVRLIYHFSYRQIHQPHVTECYAEVTCEKIFSKSS